MAARNFNYWVRTLHLYLGLFLSPFILIFALSAIVIAHAAMPWGGSKAPVESRTVAFQAPGIEDNLAFAKEVQRRLGIAGEADYVGRRAAENSIVIPVRQPGLTRTIRIDTAAATATIETQKTGFWDGLVYLHKKPGPHNLVMQKNSWPMAVWAVLADATIALLLFATASGIYLWLLLRSERKAGLAFLGLGAVSFVAAVLAVAA
jgi:hypothetical protein